ncbi:DUF763 domain-containing protein [Candidatus Methylacidiphilum fumarolicum]|nr:DUF763 domain-containing protein [Candidatus Methylacidiphilum fumarolicum]MBW6415670.1 DUF763 domain-containing protein [Candidatus Methylacidiphilum fumarolicum]TFE66806.1 hypothetical protein A7K73_10015 [Candidatus Methylacidiphilum fumarolicum]TFE71736.1 DUF763 domain-containing protein [Candidatus Methylacidiphilum fumarolicum]TFE73660.1 DUF763 domain-containing protein [Candidatus Methylacidiphilum fumarolicum]TFE77616.1 hypothetical protein A7D33_03750 [Candidatus Methylacidiphilum 
MKRKTAYLPLHYGKAPSYLFERMVRLARAMTQLIVEEYGPDEMLRRLSDPWWFQAFGCVLGFDWHSSGLTTVCCGALKEAQKRYGDIGIFVAGGKGGESRKTPEEIARIADRLAINAAESLIRTSRLVAKVDSAALQDGFALYHHCFFFTASGSWCVIQQGMNETTRYARRYHWLGESTKNFVCNPHAAIDDLSEENEGLLSESEINKKRQTPDKSILLNMIAGEAERSRQTCSELAREKPQKTLNLISEILCGPTLFAPARHTISSTDIRLINLKALHKAIVSAYERNPKDFQSLLETPHVGPATIRSLALVAELLFGVPICRKDPIEDFPKQINGRRWADYAFAHGGKDGIPYPIDRVSYDRNIGILEETIRRAKLGYIEKKDALKRLAHIAQSSLHTLSGGQCSSQSLGLGW